MTTKIIITNAGSGISATLDIYSNQSGLWTFFQNVPLSSLLLGYTFTPPPGATAYQVRDTGTCSTILELSCGVTPSTSTTTTNTTAGVISCTSYMFSSTVPYQTAHFEFTGCGGYIGNLWITYDEGWVGPVCVQDGSIITNSDGYGDYYPTVPCNDVTPITTTSTTTLTPHPLWVARPLAGESSTLCGEIINGPDVDPSTITSLYFRSNSMIPNQYSQLYTSLDPDIPWHPGFPEHYWAGMVGSYSNNYIFYDFYVTSTGVVTQPIYMCGGTTTTTTTSV